MPDNPWQVKNVQAFLFLNCPECQFKTKKQNSFQDHAVERHPSSVVLFNNINENDPLEVESYTKNERLDFEDLEFKCVPNEETLEDIMFPNINKVTNKKPKMCTKRLRRLREKKLHEEINRQGRELFQLCSFCKQSFTNIADLKIHVKRHQNVLPMAIIGRVLLGFEFQ